MFNILFLLLFFLLNAFPQCIQAHNEQPICFEARSNASQFEVQSFIQTIQNNTQGFVVGDEEFFNSLKYPSHTGGSTESEILIEDLKAVGGFLWNGLAWLGNGYMNAIEGFGNLFDPEDTLSTRRAQYIQAPSDSIVESDIEIQRIHCEEVQEQYLITMDDVEDIALLQEPTASFRQIWPDGAAMEKELQLWKQELEEWPLSSQEAARERFNARCAAYEKTKNNPYALTTQLYELSDDGIELLQKNEIDLLIFTQGMYNPLQHQLHTELIDILERTADLIKHCAYKKEFETSRDSLVSLATIGAQFNKIGDAIKTATIADVCLKLIECELALKQGIADGVINVATYVWENPHELILYALAPEVMGGYYMAKLAYNLGAGVKNLYTKGVEQKTIDDLTLQDTIQGSQ